MQGRSPFLVAIVAWASAAAAEPPPLAPLPRIVPTLDRPCGQGGEEEIVVCGRREERRSPYRIPRPPEHFDPAGTMDSVSRERNGMLDFGDTGIHSCSTVGPAGYTGCTFKAWKAEREQFGHKKPRPRRPD